MDSFAHPLDESLLPRILVPMRRLGDEWYKIYNVQNFEKFFFSGTPVYIVSEKVNHYIVACCPYFARYQ